MGPDDAVAAEVSRFVAQQHRLRQQLMEAEFDISDYEPRP